MPMWQHRVRSLYCGARGLCGLGTPEWRWLDLRGLAAGLVCRRTGWAGARVERVVYVRRVLMAP
jgi:hypothetical protein